MRSTAAFIFAVALLTGGVAACAHDDGAAGGTGDVSEVNASVLGDVGAFALEDGRTIAAPAKVAKLVAAITKPKEGKLKCLPTTTFAIFAKDGKKSGSLAMLCNPEDAESGKVTAQLDVGARSFIVDFDVRVADDVRTAPAAVGDLLFGVDKLAIARGLGEAISTPSTANIARAIEALGADQVPEQGRAPKCLPDASLTFYRGTKTVATVTGCGTAGSIDVPAAKISGGLEHVDGADLERLLEQLHQDDS